MKKLILDYLQKNAFNLYKMYGLLDARFEDDPPRLVLESDREMKIPQIMYQDKELPVEIVVVGVKSNLPKVSVTASTPMDTWKKRHGKATNIDTILNPNDDASPNQPKTQNTSAYDAWVKRHSGIKRGT